MSTLLAPNTKPSADAYRISRTARQLKLRPVLIGMLCAVTATFLGFSHVQTDRVRAQISVGPAPDPTRGL